MGPRSALFLVCVSWCRGWLGWASFHPPSLLPLPPPLLLEKSNQTNPCCKSPSSEKRGRKEEKLNPTSSLWKKPHLGVTVRNPKSKEWSFQLSEPSVRRVAEVPKRYFTRANGRTGLQVPATGVCTVACWNASRVFAGGAPAPQVPPWWRVHGAAAVRHVPAAALAQRSCPSFFSRPHRAPSFDCLFSTACVPLGLFALLLSLPSSSFFCYSHRCPLFRIHVR